MAQIINKIPISLNDPEYFCNKSWTLSFNMNTKSWTSFHSYIPNFYIAENNFFYSGMNECCSDFDFVAGVLSPVTTSTTTTSTTSTTTSTTSTTSTTTTSTTTLPPVCETCPSPLVANYLYCDGIYSVPPIAPTSQEVLVAAPSWSYGTTGAKFYKLEAGEYVEDLTIPILETSVVWKNVPWNLTDGPLNRNGVWSTTAFLSNQYIGFGRKVTVASTGIYYIGIGADNYMSCYVNSVLIKAFPSGDTLYDHMRSWHMFPVTLTAGENLIHVIGYNNDQIASIGAEIYDATLSQLQNVTSVAELENYVIFSTSSLIGQNVEEGNYGFGYTCSEGWTLVNNDGVFSCEINLHLPCGDPLPTTTTTTSTTSTTTTLSPTTTTTTTIL